LGQRGDGAWPLGRQPVHWHRLLRYLTIRTFVGAATVVFEVGFCRILI
jgi:hypothetical protein